MLRASSSIFQLFGVYSHAGPDLDISSKPALYQPSSPFQGTPIFQRFGVDSNPWKIAGRLRAVLYFPLLFHAILLYCAILYCTILYYTILYYTILYYTILYYSLPFQTPWKIVGGLRASPRSAPWARVSSSTSPAASGTTRWIGVGLRAWKASGP